MTIVDALKELFVKFGGNETDFDAETVSQALDQISDVAESGGGGWDAGIDFLFYDEHVENPSVQFAFGSYDALKEKYDAGMLPMIFFNDQLRRSYLYEIEKYWEDEYDPDSLVLYVDRSDGFVQCIIQPDNTISHNIIYSD